MSFTLTPVNPPVTGKDNTEYDTLVSSTLSLQEQGKWGSVEVLASEVDIFKRRFREAANRAGRSGRFAKDGAQDEKGNVRLTFTLQDRITRSAKPSTGNGKSK